MQTALAALDLADRLRDKIEDLRRQMQRLKELDKQIQASPDVYAPCSPATVHAFVVMAR